MSYQLQNQVNVWWRAISSEDTFKTYQKTLQVTWQILQETAKLLWLFLCLGLVLFTWLWDATQGSGQQLKAWVDTIPEPKTEHIWTEIRTRLVSLSRASTTTLIAQARAQLGLSTITPKATLESPPAAAPGSFQAVAVDAPASVIAETPSTPAPPPEA